MAPDNTTDDSNTADGSVEHEDDIDWPAVITATESDWLRRRFAFNSADCATEEEVTTSLHAWIHSVFEEATDHVDHNAPMRSDS